MHEYMPQKMLLAKFIGLLMSGPGVGLNGLKKSQSQILSLPLSSHRNGFQGDNTQTETEINAPAPAFVSGCHPVLELEPSETRDDEFSYCGTLQYIVIKIAVPTDRMSASRQSESNHQKLNELLSIYIKSSTNMIGRKENRLNLKISTKGKRSTSKPLPSAPAPEKQTSSLSQRAKSHRSAVNLTMSSKETRVTFSTDRDLDKEVEHIFHPIQDTVIPESPEGSPLESPPPRRCMTSPTNTPRESPKLSPNFTSNLDKSDRKTPSPKEAYARILATLKRIEEEERFNSLPKPTETNEISVDNMLDKLHSLDLDEMSNVSSPIQAIDSPKTAKKSTASANALPTVPDSPRVPMSSASTPRLPPLDSARSLHALKRQEHFDDYSDGLHSARSVENEPVRLCKEDTQRPLTAHSPRWEPTAEKAKNIFSFLDEVEKCDREILFNLKTEKSPSRGMIDGSSGDHYGQYTPRSSDFTTQTMDSLIRRGSIELAREIILLQRKIEEYQHNVKVLEETLINQRELNMRHIRNSERDLKKRLKLQQEEFELALSRHQSFVDQLISEKRALQDKCEKVLRDLKDAEMKHQDQVKSLQEKHLDELKRLRKLQESSDKNRRIKWMGNKTQEIRETTIKNLEPELQRVIQRHQQEMTETRAWHASELQEMEERCARKLTKQAQELREKMLQEKEDAMRRERELIQRRHDAEMEHLKDEIEAQKRRYSQELYEERERFEVEQAKVKDLIQENVKKVEIKAEVELETAKEQYEAKVMALERKHETEVKALTSVHEAEKESYIANFNKKLEQAMAEKELFLAQACKAEKEAELEEREKRLRLDFDKQWKEQEDIFDSRLKRLQEKLQNEITEFEETEKELKAKFSQVRTELIAKEEEIFTLKTTLNLKEKQIAELSDCNMKMLEERANLTAVIRREFASQIEALEQDCMEVKSSVVELKSKQKLEQEQHKLELERVRQEKDNELERVGQRVVQAMARKEETIVELQKQLEKAAFRVSHLEELLEQQRKEFVHSMTGTCQKGPRKLK